MATAIFSFALSFIASTVISLLFPAEGPRLKDLSVSSSAYGNVIPEVWGTVRVAANMIWSSNIVEHKHKKKAGLGQYYNQYTYTASFAMAFCKGPASAIRRVWANGKVIYDVTGNSANVTNGKFRIATYLGTEDQFPDPTISAALPGTTPAYRGITYAVFTDFQLEDYGNQIPQMAAEVYVSGELSPVATADLPSIGTFQSTQLVLDADRNYVYLYSTPNILHQVNTKTMVDRPQAVTSGQPHLYDSGNLSFIHDIDANGEVFVTLGVQNSSQYGTVDSNSLQVTGRIGNAWPFSGGAPGALDNLYIENGYGVMNTTGDMFLLAGQFGACWILYPLNSGLFEDPTDPPPISNKGIPIHINLGGVYQSRYICESPDGGWFVFYGGDATGGNPSTAHVYYVPEQQAGVVEYTQEIKGYDLVNPGGGNNFTPTAVAADSNGVILCTTSSAGSYITKYSFETSSIVWQTKLAHGGPSHWQGRRIDVLNQIAWVSNGKVFILNTNDGTFINRAPDQNSYADADYIEARDIEYSNPGIEGYALPANTGNGVQRYDGATGQLVVLPTSHSSEVPRIIYSTQFGSGTVTLQFIVESLLQRAGLLPSDYDMSALGATVVRGYGFGQTTDIKSVISELQRIFLFDLYESDGRLTAIVRGKNTPDETISWKALGNSSNDSNSSPNFWRETRLSEADIPSVISLKYMNVDQDFEQNTATSKRILAPVPEVFSRQRDEVEAAIVFDATEAKNRANVMLYTSWAERTKHNSRLPLAYSYLDPSDVISVNLSDGRNYFERINETEFGADFSTNIETFGQDSGAYTSDVVGSGGNGMGQELAVPVPATPFVFNTPYLRDTDVVGDGKFSIFYMAVGNLVREHYNGAGMYVSEDGGGSYSLLQIFPKDCEWGSVNGVVPGASHGAFALDWETKITIWPAIDAFALSSCTDDDLVAGANFCIVGDEVMQFRDAVDNGNGSWTISNLLRGRRGTEWAIDNHAANERFVFLDATVMDISQEPLDSGGKEFIFKAVGTGRDITTARTLDIDYECRDLMPYAPVQLAAAWNGGDIKVSFQRRTRWNGNLQDGTGIVPLNETVEAYEMDIYDGDTVVRTISVKYGIDPLANPYVTYSAADLVQDWPTQPIQITVELFQMGVVGRGFGTKATLTISGVAAPTARFFGASSSTSLTEGDILALGGEDLANDFVKSLTYDCTGGKYPYYCFPASYGTPAHVKVNGLPFSAFTQTTQMVGGNSYHVIRFDLLQHGAAIPVDWM